MELLRLLAPMYSNLNRGQECLCGLAILHQMNSTLEDDFTQVNESARFT